MEEQGVGKIYLLNPSGKNVDKQCLLEKVKTIVAYADAGQLVPLRVRIWKEHPIVKEALSMETVKVERGDKSALLIPLKYRGQRVIFVKNDSYGVRGVASEDKEVAFSECFK